MELNLKKINKSLFTVLIFVSLITFCDFPTSNSKFFKDFDPNDSLYYGINVKALDKDKVALKVDSKEIKPHEDKIGFIATFYRSNYLLPTDTIDTYVIAVDSDCKINSIFKDDIELKDIDFEKKNNKAEVIFKKSKSTIDKYDKTPLEVKYTCTASKIKTTDGKRLQSTVSISEYFNTETKIDTTTEYNLGSASSSYLYSRYEEKMQNDPYIDPATGVLYMPKNYSHDENVTDCNDDDFCRFVKTEYIPDSGKKYFESVYNPKNITNITTSDSEPPLKGLTITANDKYYIYTMDKFYLSYARTYSSHSSGGNSYYFLDVNFTDQEMLELLRYYLSIYPGYDSQQIADIEKYMEPYKLSDLFKGTVINGIKVTVENRCISMPNILAFVYPSKSMDLHYDDGSDTIYEEWEQQENSVFVEIADLRDYVFNTDEFRALILETTPTTEIINHEVIPYGTRKAMVIVHSDPNGDGGRGLHKVYIYEIKTNTTYNIPFLKPTSQDDVDSINKINETLRDFAINTTLTFDNLTTTGIVDGIDIVVEDNSNIIHLSFTTAGVASANVSNLDLPSQTTTTTTTIKPTSQITTTTSQITTQTPTTTSQITTQTTTLP